MSQNIIAAIVVVTLLFASGYAFADTTVGATLVGVQNAPQDLQQVVGSSTYGSQDTVYENQAVATANEYGSQDTVYENQMLIGSVKVFDQNASIPIVQYSATYNPDNNTTTVHIEINSDPTPIYNIFIYSPTGKLLTSFTSSSPSADRNISGKYEKLYIVVIANSIGTAGEIDYGIYPQMVFGTNIIPVRVYENGKYSVKVYGGYALSPVYVDANRPIYIIAEYHLVDVTVTK